MIPRPYFIVGGHPFSSHTLEALAMEEKAQQLAVVLKDMREGLDTVRTKVQALIAKVGTVFVICMKSKQAFRIF